jgi:O-antigen/teichoic acid export membrane protein
VTQPRTSSQAFGQGAAWLGGLTLGRYLVSFASQIALARLISPRGFGDFALMLAFVSMGSALATVHARQWLVKKKELSPRDLGAAFTVELIFGALVTLLFVMLAPLMLGLLGREELGTPFRAMSLVVLVTSFSIPSALLQRQMRFGGIYLPQLAGVLANAATAVTLATTRDGLWALVTGKLVGHLVETVFIWRLAPRQPTLLWDREIATSICRFGLPLVGMTLLVQVYWHVDQVLIERLLDPRALGFYFLAYQLAKQALHVRTGLNQIALPVFARQQIAASRLSFRRLTWLNAVVYLGMASVAIASGELIVTTLFGARWSPAALPFRILMLATAWRGIVGYYEPLMVLHDGRHILFRSTLALTLVLPAAVTALAIPQGIAGAATGVLFAAASTSFIPIVWARRHLGLSLDGVLRGPLIAFFVAASAGYALESRLLRDFFGLSVGIVMPGLVFLFTLFLADRARLTGLWCERRSWIDPTEEHRHVMAA